MRRQGIYKIREVKLLSTGEENPYYKHLFFKEVICSSIEVGSHAIFVDPNTFTSVNSGVIRVIVDKFNGKDLVLVTHCNVFVLERRTK